MSIIFDLVEEDFGLEKSDDNLSHKWLDLAKSNINEFPDKKLSLLNDFKTLVHNNPKSAKFLTQKFLLDDQYLKIYLRAGEWDLSKAMDVLDKFYSIGINYKKYVERSLPSKLDKVWSAQLNTVCKSRDKFGRRVAILNLGKWDPGLIPVEDWFASTYVLLEVITREVKTQIAGLTVILNCEGFSFTHIRHLGVDEVRLASAFLSGSFPLWVRRIHFVNQPRIFEILMKVVRPFLTESAKDVLVFHGYELSTLHEEVSKEILPKELGGKHQFDNSQIVQAAKNMEDDYQELIKIALTL